MMDASHPSVMILGCGRSGTSIFGELFEHLPGYRYRSEPMFEEVIGADYFLPHAFKVPRESAIFPAKPGLSFPLPVMQKHHPEMKYFWTVRHPLDTVCSLRVGIAQNWGHHPRPADWESWLERPVIERCAHHWAYLNRFGFDQVKDIAKLVRFEDMILDAGRFASNVCQHLGIDPEYAPDEIVRWVARVQNSNNADFVEAETSRHYSRPDHAVRVGRWRDNLTPDEVEAILPIVADTAVAFGYELP